MDGHTLSCRPFVFVAVHLLLNISFNCKCGGSPSIRWDKICNTRANLLTETCTDVAMKPNWKQLTGETWSHMSANCEDHAQVDIAARGFGIPVRKPLLMWESSIHSVSVIARFYFGHVIAETRWRKEGAMRRELPQLNMDVSPLWYSQQQVEWVQHQPSSTRNSLQWFQCCMISHTPRVLH